MIIKKCFENLCTSSWRNESAKCIFVKQFTVFSFVKISFGIPSEYEQSSDALYKPVEKSANKRKDPLVFLTTIRAAQCEYLIGLKTASSSNLFNHLSNRGREANGTGHFEVKTGRMFGGRYRTAFCTVQHPVDPLNTELRSN